MRISSALFTILFSTTLCASAQTAPSYTPPPSCTVTLKAPMTAGPQMSQYAADRENAMATAYLALACRDYETSYQLFLKALDKYPDDARILNISATTAALAGHDDAAIALYKRTIQQASRFTYSARSSLMNIYLRLGRWDDFQAERLEARAADRAGTLAMSRDQPMTIDQLRVGSDFVSVVEFPALYGPNHTLDRFDLRDEKDICANFTPYVDLAASDPAGGVNTIYSLLAFPTPATRWLIKTYPPGEPPYQTVRADVQAALAKPLTSIKPPAICSTPTPSASNGGLSPNTGPITSGAPH